MTDTKGVANNTFVHGVQSVSAQYLFNPFDFFDGGRTGRSDDTYPSPAHEITLEKVCTSFDDLFSVVLANEPSSYEEGLLLRPSNFGYNITGNAIYDIKQFDLDLVYGDSNQAVLTPLGIARFEKCLLTEYTLSMTNSGVFTQSLAFQNKTVKFIDENLPNFNLEDLPLTANVVTRKDFDLINSILPSHVLDNASFGVMLDGQEIYGITNINTSLRLNYKEHLDTGLWAGAIDNNNQNLWTSINLPIEVRCSITISAQKGNQLTVNESNVNFTYQPIKLVYKMLDDSNNIKYYVIDLGSKNRLMSISSNSVSTSNGENLEYTFEYSNVKNDFSVYVKNTFD